MSNSIIKVLTYNVSWQATTGNRFRNGMKMGPKDDVLDNISQIISNGAPYDFLAMQEATSYEDILKRTDKIKDMDFRVWMPANYAGLKDVSNFAYLVTFWDKKYNLQFWVEGHVYNYYKHTFNRPYQLLIFENDICFINIHQGHGDGADVMHSIQQIERDILNPLFYNKKYSVFRRNLSSKKLIEKLKKCRIIMAGDFNNSDLFQQDRKDPVFKIFSNLKIGKNMFNVSKSEAIKTCCDTRPPYVHYDHSPDHVFDSKCPPISIKNIVPTHFINRGASDHLPILSNLC